jgi:hypothetical protein
MNPAHPGILVIEDDPDTCVNLRDILELDRYRVEIARSAAEGLARIAGGRGKYFAIILDRRLPDARAEDLLPRLKARLPDAAIIVVTAYSDIEGAIVALRLGAADYLLKPFNPDLLRASLERIAERHQLAQAKESSEAAFHYVLEAVNCMVVIARPDETIVYFSPFAEQLTGWSASQVVGRNFFDWFIPEPERASARGEHRRIVNGKQLVGYETEILCGDGSRRSVLWNVRMLPDYEGEPAAIGIGQDITGLKQAQKRALQAERLAAIGQMVAGLAHESRNALQRSQACLEMLALAVRDRPEALDLIARLQKAQDDLHHLYEDVRTYAAPIVLERRWCDLGEIWREAWSHLSQIRMGKEVVFREPTHSVDLRCLADPFRLSQVFRNILENSLIAGKDRVEIDVRAEEARLEGRPAIRIVIADNGPGIAPERRRDVFEPFYTTKLKGTGLGMPIAKRIVEAHGGTLAIGENPPPGAEFLITLPRESP